jgi:DNA-binding NarL/FixJ family response regulator
MPALSASDAPRLCGYNQPDLMVLHLGLPDAGGIDVLREIRTADGDSGRFDPGLPVIVLSGRGSEADRLRGFGAGADDYLVKAIPCPFAWEGALLDLALASRAKLDGVGPSGPDEVHQVRVELILMRGE